MQIKKIHCFQLQIPLRLFFEQANQSARSSDSVVLRLETSAGSVGYGECGPRSYLSGETAEQVRTSMQRATSEVWSRDFSTISDIESLVGSLPAQDYGPAFICALELALLDAWSREYQQDLREALGALAPCSIPYTGIVPYGAWEELVPLLAQFHFRQWKLKATPAWEDNALRVEQLRSLIGMDNSSDAAAHELEIRFDANGSWTLEQAQRNIEEALALGVTSFEQPLAVGQDAAVASLTADYGADASIVADEALVSYADAERFIANGSYNHFNLKLSKNGGIFNSLRIYRLAGQHAIPCQLGAQYGETSLLSAAGALFADLVPQLSAREGALGTWLLQEDITTEPVMIDRFGTLVPRSSKWGLGVDISELRLNQYSLRTDLWCK